MNRRMPNGMYGGVRGEKKNLPYSMYDRSGRGLMCVRTVCHLPGDGKR